MYKWTFLTNHAVVLLAMVNNSRITAIEIAQFVGITERAVRNIISDLEREGYIEKTKTGKRVQYRNKLLIESGCPPLRLRSLSRRRR